MSRSSTRRSARRNRKPITRSRRRAVALARRVALGPISAGIAGFALIAAGLHAVADTSLWSSDGFARRPYIAFGGGATRLEPESSSSALTVSDETSAGVEAGIGYDINRWLSAELHIADLGAADIDFIGTSVGDVEYLVYGATAVAYLFGPRDGFVPFSSARDGAFRREGLSLFGRFGVGGLSNERNGEFAHRQDHVSHAVFGAGLEYGFRNGFALRAELQAFDTDARYAGIGVLKRFGRASTGGPLADVGTVPEPPTAALPPPTEPRPAAALPEGPTMFRPVVPPYIYFAFDRAELSMEARAKLDAFVEEMNESPLDIVVEGHTDWIGGERYNEGLSRRRAETVRGYLVESGVDPARISIEAYGETRPLVPNLTAEGRALNRRAEFRLE